MDKKTEFFPHDQVIGGIRMILQEQWLLLKDIFTGKKVIIEHVGSSAVPHSLTKKDLDIQVRVTAEDFDIAKQRLAKFYREHHKALWNDEFAIFTAIDFGFHIDIMLTVIDSKYDDFWKVRDYLINNPLVLEEYNALKIKYTGKDYTVYTRAKEKFFGKNGEVRFFQ